MNAYAEGKINTFSCILLQKKFCYRNYRCELYKLQNEQEILNLRIFGFLALILEKSKTFCLLPFLYNVNIKNNKIRIIILIIMLNLIKIFPSFPFYFHHHIWKFFKNIFPYMVMKFDRKRGVILITNSNFCHINCIFKNKIRT